MPKRRSVQEDHQPVMSPTISLVTGIGGERRKLRQRQLCCILDVLVRREVGIFTRVVPR